MQLLIIIAVLVVWFLISMGTWKTIDKWRTGSAFEQIRYRHAIELRWLIIPLAPVLVIGTIVKFLIDCWPFTIGFALVVYGLYLLIW